MRRRPLAVVALAVVLALASAGCGDGSPVDVLGGGGGGIDADLVAFANPGAGSVGGVAVRIESSAAAAAFAGWFASSHPALTTELTAKMAAARPGEGRVLLGFAEPGCAEDGARLHRDGDDLEVEFTGGEGVDCAAAAQLVAVFAVGEGDLPTDVTLEGRRPPPHAGPGRPVVFDRLDADIERPTGGDLADPAVLERFTGDLHDAVAAAVRGAVDAATGDDRVIGSVVSGCQLRSAELVITGRSVAAVAAERPRGPVCDANEDHLVVFRVEDRFIPDDAEITG